MYELYRNERSDTVPYRRMKTVPSLCLRKTKIASMIGHMVNENSVIRSVSAVFYIHTDKPLFLSCGILVVC